MWGQMQGKTKVEIAREVLGNSVDKLPSEQNIGLVAYGHRKEGDCTDVEFILDSSNSSKEEVKASLQSIKPLGKTPLAYSALQVIEKLRQSKQKATIILITDGIESCGGNMCEVITAAKKEGIEFKLHVIGFGLKEGETEQLRCAAKAGDGQYFDADDAEKLGEALDHVAAIKVDEPASNLSIYASKNGQAIDAMVYTGVGENKVGVRTYADTGFVYLRAGSYDIEITPLEGSDVSPIVIKGVVIADKPVHRDVSFDSGKLKVITTNNGLEWDSAVKVFDLVSGKTVAAARTYGREIDFDLNHGIYRVEYIPIGFRGRKFAAFTDSLVINASSNPIASFNFETGILAIGAKSGSEMVDAVVSLVYHVDGIKYTGVRTYTATPSNVREIIVPPGKYTATAMGVGAHKGKTKTVELDLEPGEKLTHVFEL